MQRSRWPCCENFRIPFIGWTMRLNRYIELEQGDRDSIVATIRRCAETLAERKSAENLARSVREVLAKHLGDDAVE